MPRYAFGTVKRKFEAECISDLLLRNFALIIFDFVKRKLATPPPTTT